MENWKSLKGIVENGDSYEVSNLGNVRSIDRLDSRGCNRKGKLMKPKTSKKGYIEVTLTKNNKGKTYKMHRLVALAFIPNIENKPEVNHKDGNKGNNKMGNLEWSTPLENISHAIKNGLSKKSGEDNDNSTLTEVDVRKIREMYATKEYILKEIADIYGVSFQHISAIVNYKLWKDVE
ncbi:HNH endonuclease [Bacillus phage Izhevsk]|uniref:HNH endonuclease n=1 Tax=Bacillus phage Izhevsk TaxID=2724322 RepID=A0A6H0X6G2_9CAUD|nr:HNH endonuclease [Bacillus phage Izhevsk]QIW89920.1 HNH endonuclease [Bacillus phage Izhevsk]